MDLQRAACVAGETGGCCLVAGARRCGLHCTEHCYFGTHSELQPAVERCKGRGGRESLR